MPSKRPNSLKLFQIEIYKACYTDQVCLHWSCSPLNICGHVTSQREATPMATNWIKLDLICNNTKWPSHRKFH